MTEEKDFPVEGGVFLLDLNLVGWFDLMYTLLGLEPGESTDISAIFPDRLEERVITITVRSEMEEIEAHGSIQQVLVCDLTPFEKQETHYILPDGTLLKVERPAKIWLSHPATTAPKSEAPE